MIKVSKLNKIYERGNVHALKDVDVEVDKGDFLVIIGLSGSGKSTFLRTLNRLIDPTNGDITVDGEDVVNLKGSKLRLYRGKIGMIFQHFNLIPRKTVLTNVLCGSLARKGIVSSVLGIYSKEEIDQAMKNIEIVGLIGKENQRADNLSGGQQQRVAIARALMQNPKVLLADEPVASLDPATSHSVMKYLKKVNEELGVTIICNLHFLSLVREYASKVIALKDGELVYQGAPSEIDELWFKKIYGEDAVEVTIN